MHDDLLNSSVGRGHIPAGAGTINCVQICSFVLSAAYAVGGDMSPPYREFHDNDIERLTKLSLRGAQRCGNLVQERLIANKFESVFVNCFSNVDFGMAYVLSTSLKTMIP